jgi:dTDP-4-dehydrorhamnose 3,5-epimerase
MDGMSASENILNTSLAGVWAYRLKIIPTVGGPVLHMLRTDSPLFAGFGEIYFSELEPGAIKSWKRHREQSQTFAVPVGRIEFVLYDGRDASPSFGTLERLVLGRPDEYKLLRIPPGLWYSFASRSETPSLIANLADQPHRADEIERLPLDAPGIPYCWKV